MLGSHLSVAGGLVNALFEGERLKLETVQIFTRNQRQWRAKALDVGVVNDWLTELKRLGWMGRTVSHSSYLINLGSPDAGNFRKSVDTMTDEVERCETLSIPFCVVHPGSHRGEGMEAGVRTVIKGLDEVIGRTSGFRTMILLETTVGNGHQIGSTFGELGTLREGVCEPDRVGICVDTCHISAAGYDISSRSKAGRVFDDFDEKIGLEHLRCFHLNDSKEPIGSRRDRHEHIGEGHVGKEGFGWIMNQERFTGLPMILETPKTMTAKGTPMDLVNVRRLRRMVK